MDSFEQLRAEFLAETEDTLASLQRDLDDLSAVSGADELPADVLDRVFRTTHSIKGVAGMFGLERMSEVAHALEGVFEELRSRRRTLDGALVDRLYEGHEHLWRLLGEATDEGAEAAADVERWVLALERDRPSRAPGDSRFADLRRQLSEDERHSVARATAEGCTVAIVEARYGEHELQKSFQELLVALRAWGFVHATIPDDDISEPSRFGVRLVVSGTEPLFSLLKIVRPLGAEAFGDNDGELLALVGDLTEHVLPPELSGNESPLPGPPPEESGGEEPPASEGWERVPEPDVPPGGAKPAAPERAARGGVLRVPVARVDRLLSELGDVVQAKLALDATAEQILDHAPDRMTRTRARQSLRSLERQIRSLQGGILGVRMVSLEPLFQKLERAFRETCRITGKRAELVTEGERTELDKGIAEALAEPLVHLVRNAVDHGLETESERVAAGKSPSGTVRISAFPDGSWTVLEVRDDGAGLDLDSVLAKARAQGLVAEGARPSRAELTELIFCAGLSVRDEATSVSGRGVGLDAVRNDVASLGGRIDVESDETGTTFRLRLPVSLTITLALEVEVAGQTFFLPMTNVTSVGRTDPGRLEQVDGREILVEADSTRDVRDLAELYGLGRVRRDRERIPTVTIAGRDVDLVLLVDRLGRRTEIVVRPLGGVLPAIPGIVGSTELADGRTILVLEPTARPARAGSPPEAEA